MRAGTYYVISAVLVLATVPMYRYIFHRARQLDQPELVQSAPVAFSPEPRSTVDHRPLMRGEECHGGYVFFVNGSSYSQAFGPGHVAVRCDTAGELVSR